MPVDGDTQKYLEEVKKGKPRRFVMICKGVKILSLLVYKKGTVEKYKKQAKEEGKGQFYHGVVDGKGQNISFKLLRADGYDKPPGKELILKDFLKKEADMKFKPVYEIVDVLPEIDEVDDVSAPPEAPSTSPADVPPPPPPPKGTEVPPPPPPPESAQVPPPPPPPETAQVPPGPPRPETAQVPPGPPPPETAQVPPGPPRPETAQVPPGPPRPETAQVPPGPPRPETARVPPTPTAEEVAYASRLKSMMPHLKKALSAESSVKLDLKKRAGEALAFATQKYFDHALAKLDEVQQLIDTAMAEDGRPGPSSTKPEPEDEYATAIEELDARYQQAVKTAPKELAGKLKAVYGYISEQAKKGTPRQFKKAVLAIRRLEAMLKEAKSTQPDEVETDSGLKGTETATEPADTVTEAPTPPPPPTNNYGAEFRQRLQELKPRLKNAREAGTTFTAQITELTAQLQKLAKAENFADALGILAQLEEVVQLASPTTESATDTNARGRMQWDSAREQVSGQISSLQKALRSINDPRLARIADMGLNGITGRYQVAIRVALLEFETAPAQRREAARKKLLKAIDDYRNFIQTSELVSLIDANPFGVNVSVRSTLGSGLTGLRSFAEG